MKLTLILAGEVAFGTALSAAPPATTPGGTTPATPATPADPAAGTPAAPATPAQPAAKATDDTQATPTEPAKKKKKPAAQSATSPDGVGVATPGAAKATKAKPKDEAPPNPQ
jgi:hypothetical protein